MDVFDRPLAITDVETTGLDPDVHEIIDIGLFLVDQRTLEPIKSMDYRVKPLHLENASVEALRINGYNEEDWQDAYDLESVMKLYAYLTRDAIFVAHNVTFDWSFIEKAFRTTRVPHMMDYHRIDLFSLAWGTKKKLPGLERLNLKELCRYLGVQEEPSPHTGINGAMCEWGVLKKISML